MIILLLLLATPAVLMTAGLWTTITHDGLGVRPAPRSHVRDTFGASYDS
ncbi:hypothetical protein H1W00_09790 [Aeromicrobium sp. Marseille-Q0843]|uniref:Uncharacterized protein n=1 Tax=Aeromicrobium phoceense TaxID=2754045 RepID=A0A838XP51_9ACTN|nr:hypothetical protein [Aeromicrobium phoceense]MBA4608763.1 hypothetical protein [Aeromicrobium phoceense]